jgi:hypothetical protein
VAERSARRKVRPFQRLQYRFAAHLRDPRRNAAPPGIERRRLKIYTELFYNNVEGFLSSAFPVLRRITPDARWHAMARDFFARHESHQPLFHKIAEEFLRYLGRRRGRVKGDVPFLRELAHYEWVELALSVAPAPPPAELADVGGDLMQGVPVVSKVAWVLTYQFPVHRIGPEFQPKAPGAQPTHLIVYRTAADEVKFMEANAITARLLQLMAARRSSGRQLLLRIARELRHPQPELIVAQGEALLADLRARDILLGTRISVSMTPHWR